MLTIQNLHAFVEKKEILLGIDLIIKPGEIHAIMGPNGSGKSTLAMSLMGHPGYNVKFQMSNFKCQIKKKDIAELLPEERARMGLFVTFQNPIEITGVSLLAFLRTAWKEMYPESKMPLSEFKKQVKEALSEVGLDETFMQRSVNEGFSGGERKRAEIVQLLVLKPRIVILDEIDSGLDVDSLRVVAKALERYVREEKAGLLVITHYQRILHFLRPNKVHVMIQGKIKKSGSMRLVSFIEKNGYAAI